MTRTNLATLFLLALALLLGGTRTAHAAESYDNCTGFITSLPAVITTQGTWCLKQDLLTAIASGNAISINTNNVTIDCNDFKIGGLAAGAATQAYGIYSNNRLNTTIRNCSVRGFFYGLAFDSSGLGGGHVIEDNRFDGNTFVGMHVVGDGSVVRRNRVLNTGGSSTFAPAQGIETFGDVDILDNTISSVVATAGGNGNASGIYAGTPGGSISGNRVRGLIKDGTGTTYAIYVDNGSAEHMTLRDNDIVSATASVGTGLLCANAAGRAMGNVISGFGTDFSGCSDDGGNVVAP